MAVELLTKEDLRVFKQELLSKLSQLLSQRKGADLSEKEWLKSYEVRKLLGISPGTLQQMRINDSPLKNY